MQINDLLTPEKIVATLCLLAAAYERFISQRKQKKTDAEQTIVNDARLFQERAAMLSKLAEDNGRLFEAEHAEHQKTRDYWHTKANEWQTTLSGCQEKLQEMNARPDYTEVVDMIKAVAQTTKAQAETSQTILQGITEIAKVLKIQAEQNQHHYDVGRT